MRHRLTLMAVAFFLAACGQPSASTPIESPVDPPAIAGVDWIVGEATPVLTVLDAGAAPRTNLAWRLAPGTVDATVHSSVERSTQGFGDEVLFDGRLDTRVQTTTEVIEVGPAGAVLRTDYVECASDHDDLLYGIEYADEVCAGVSELTNWTLLAPNGTVLATAGAEAEAWNTLGLDGTATAMLLPEVPVGVGASWQLIAGVEMDSGDPTLGTVSTTVTVLVELVRIDGSIVELTHRASFEIGDEFFDALGVPREAIVLDFGGSERTILDLTRPTPISDVADLTTYFGVIPEGEQEPYLYIRVDAAYRSVGMTAPDSVAQEL